MYSSANLNLVSTSSIAGQHASWTLIPHFQRLMALPLAPNHACMSAANGRIDDCQASSRLCNDGLMEHTFSRNMQTHKACKRVICVREHTCNAACMQGLQARHRRRSNMRMVPSG
jgi:hypothetical protein